MANDCLVTKLKGVVDNSSLEKLGQFKITLKSAQNVTITTRYSDNMAPVVLDSRISYDEGITVATPNGAAYPQYTGSGNVYFDDKYKLKIVTLRNGTFDPNSFQYCEGLAELTFEDVAFNNAPLPKIPKGLVWFFIYNNYNKTTFRGDVSELGFMQSLERISFKYTNGAITATMKGLAEQFPSLFSIGNVLGFAISGNFEDFVAIRKIQGVDSGSVALARAAYAPLLRFKGELPTSQADIELPISWTSNGNNVTITYNGESTTIAVASDGTWTRIS